MNDEQKTKVMKDENHAFITVIIILVRFIF